MAEHCVEDYLVGESLGAFIGVRWCFQLWMGLIDAFTESWRREGRRVKCNLGQVQITIFITKFSSLES